MNSSHNWPRLYSKVGLNSQAFFKCPVLTRLGICPRLDPHGGYQLQLVGDVRKKVGGVNPRGV